MSDNINAMNFKQLRNEVQLLRDELAIMKRKYEDIIYNLDDDNFSSRIVKEKGDMRTAIEVNAEGIKTKVSNEDFQSAMTQTAEKIETEVKNLDGTLSSKISQTAKEIRAEVEDVEEGILSEISQTASEIGLRVKTVEGKTNSISVNQDEILIDGEKTAITGVIYLTDNDGNKRFSFFHDESQGYEQVFFNSYLGSLPIIIGGATDDVYINNRSNYNLVATQGWVLENGGGGVAKFA